VDTKEKYDESSVRRQDRILEYGRAIELLRKGEYGFLALGGEEGYGVPMNFVSTDDCIYFHCAPEGDKLRKIAANGNTCFCVVGYTEPEPSKFTTIYESVMAFGRIGLVEDPAERMRALELLVGKYSPDFKESGNKYAEKSFDRTGILRLDIQRLSGKSKKANP